MPIANHSYDAGSQTYSVQFRDGGPTYIYQGVSQESASEVQNADADNLGKVVQSVLVRGKPYEFVKVEPDEGQGPTP